MLQAAVPGLFVLIWSTGFVVARAVVPYADPNLFLLARFVLAAAVFGLIALAAGATWPRGRALGGHLVAGALLHGVYLGAAYWAVSRGLAAGVMALFGALQPLLAALLAIAFMGERVTVRAWVGLATGLAGVGLVIAPRLLETGAGAVPPIVVAVGLLAIVGATLGTVVQKTSLAATDIRSASAVQNAGAAVVAAVLAGVLGETRWVPAIELHAALAYAVLVLSAGGTTLLVWMIRRDEAAKATALLFAVPPLAALETYAIFGETLMLVQVAGFAVALAGVLIVRRAS